MTKGSPFGLIMRFAFPLLLGNLLQQLYNIADAAIVGRALGAGALAAVGATSSVQFLILGFCIGSCTGFCVPISQRFGAKDFSGLRKLIFNSIVLAGLGAVVITTLCAVATPQILRLLSTPEDIWADTYVYILILFLGIPFTLLYNLSAGILRAVGDSTTPFVILAVSTISNIGLDLLCILVLHLGCGGAALATIASQALSGVLCVMVIEKKYPALHLLPEERHVEGRLMTTLLTMGVPMGLQFSITAIGSMMMQSANNGLGSLYASAFTASARIKGFAMCPFDAIASGVATFCGQNYGAKKPERIWQGFRLDIFTAALYGALMGLALMVFGRSVCLLFLSEKETAALDAAAHFLRLNGSFFWILGLLNVSRITVQGIGFSGRAIFSGVFEMFARGLVALFVVPQMGFDGVCIADPAAWIAADLYIIPTAFFVIQKVSQGLAGRHHFLPRLAFSHGKA
ncbi:MAG: MATE family efflux transporter [Blautia sp.]|nr:MATE family efflux transporter [Blautia sp.]